jgi:hypothetical protein
MSSAIDQVFIVATAQRPFLTRRIWVNELDKSSAFQLCVPADTDFVLS